MPYGDLVSRVDFDMTRDSAFSYTCRACMRCCRNKAIRLNPYEVLRLARRLKISTTEFVARHTEAGGTVLRSRDDGHCGFLGEAGCTVHPDRPLACRLYPLARWVTADGEESFGHLTPHPQTEGIYGTPGTVQDYLDQQETEVFFAMGDRYGELYDTMLAELEALDPDELERRQERRDAVDNLPSGMAASEWMDIDATIGTNAGEPDLERAVKLHIETIERLLKSETDQRSDIASIFASSP